MDIVRAAQIQDETSGRSGAWARRLISDGSASRLIFRTGYCEYNEP
jgi:hypothetical protein